MQALAWIALEASIALVRDLVRNWPPRPSALYALIATAGAALLLLLLP